MKKILLQLHKINSEFDESSDEESEGSDDESETLKSVYFFVTKSFLVIINALGVGVNYLVLISPQKSNKTICLILPVEVKGRIRQVFGEYVNKVS